MWGALFLNPPAPHPASGASLRRVFNRVPRRGCLPEGAGSGGAGPRWFSTPRNTATAGPPSSFPGRELTITRAEVVIFATTRCREPPLPRRSLPGPATTFNPKASGTSGRRWSGDPGLAYHSPQVPLEQGKNARPCLPLTGDWLGARQITGVDQSE